MRQNVETSPKFDIRVENTKRFFAPFQKSSREKLAVLQSQQEKYEEMMGRGTVVRAINKIFQLVKDRSTDITDEKTALAFHQKMIESVQAGEYAPLVDYLTEMLGSVITTIEKLQKELDGRPLRWGTVNQASKIPNPSLFLTEGMIVLNQLDPAAAEPFNQRLANMKIDRAFIDLRSAAE
ncbi:MAG: hypothetical protein QG639_750 [Patescibacteria group bacterium]|nr:hypothetical protein [Patescibacteria group bacterium]